MEHIPSRLISAFATLPISFILIPFAYWKSQTEPWYRVFIRPLTTIFAAWIFALFVAITIAWFVAFAVIVWQSLMLKSAIDANRPKKLPERESWRR